MPIHPPRPSRDRSVSRTSVLLVALGVTLGVALAGPRATSAQGELLLEKYVAAVNDAARADVTGVVVAPGDTVTYGLSVSSSPSLAGTEVTITDVVGTNRLAFSGAEPVGCAEDGGTISCLVTLDDAGSTEVLLSFSVLPSAGASGACQQVVNNARVQAEGGTEATAQSRIDVCPDGATTGTTTESAPSGGVAGGTPGTVGTAGGAPNTAVEPPRVPTGLLVQLGALLLGAAIVVGLHAGHHVASAMRKPSR